MTVAPRLRSSAATRLIDGTMSRALGTSIGAPGATNAFCMSMTSSAVRFASSASNRCRRPRRARTRSFISGRISTECIEGLGHLLSLALGRQDALARAEVVLHVLGPSGSGDGAGHRRVRHDPLQEVLRPAPDAELRRPRRQRLALDAAEQRAL